MQTAVSPSRAALFAALLAVIVYIPATGNRFALDDVQIVERNPAAHTVGAAVAAFAQPYWPAEHGVGQWRPVVIGSFALDWQVSGGSTVWLHASNILLHALVTALVVLFLARYVTVIGALAGGILFAVHPVHVEAVANLVGRAELLASAGLLGALLFAHAVRRRRAAQISTWLQEIGLLGCVVLALLSKEHAAIAIALLWLDDRARPADKERLPLRDYVATLLVTAIWLLARHSVDRGASFANVAPAFIHLGAVGRFSTMLPVIFVVLRLMVWPWDLSYDYRPQVVERLDHLTPMGAFGLLVFAALLALTLLAWRKDRTVSLGLLVIFLAWLPTSNLLFPTGIVLSERTLYLSSVGLALLAARGADALARRGGTRTTLLLSAILALPLAARTWTREDVWLSTRRLVLSAMTTQPESYAVHEALGRALWLRGQRQDALREYEIAAELFPLDPYLQTRLAALDLEAGRTRDAVRHARAAERVDSTYAFAQEALAVALLRLHAAPAALAHAQRALAAQPADPQSLSILADVYDSLGVRDSARAVRARIPARPAPLSRQQ
jgi:tetratricopeptide (TPR) repeat protein